MYSAEDAVIVHGNFCINCEPLVVLEYIIILCSCLICGLSLYCTWHF